MAFFAKHLCSNSSLYAIDIERIANCYGFSYSCMLKNRILYGFSFNSLKTCLNATKFLGF